MVQEYANITFIYILQIVTYISCLEKSGLSKKNWTKKKLECKGTIDLLHRGTVSLLN